MGGHSGKREPAKTRRYEIHRQQAHRPGKGLELDAGMGRKWLTGDWTGDLLRRGGALCCVRDALRCDTGHRVLECVLCLDVPGPLRPPT